MWIILALYRLLGVFGLSVGFWPLVRSKVWRSFFLPFSPFFWYRRQAQFILWNRHSLFYMLFMTKPNQSTSHVAWHKQTNFTKKNFHKVRKKNKFISREKKTVSSLFKRYITVDKCVALANFILQLDICSLVSKISADSTESTTIWK